MNFDTLFVNPKGRTGRNDFLGGLLTLLVAVAIYSYFVKGRTGQWCILVLLAPAIVLHARRLHDMGQTAWVLLAPVAVIFASIYLRMVSRGSQMEVGVTYAALAVAAAFALWGVLGKGQSDENRYGAVAA